MVAKTRLGVAHVLAEAKHHAELIGVHPEESGKSPDGDRGENDQADPFAAEVTARQHGAQLVLAAAQKLFEIGRRWVLAPRAPRSAALIAPRHRITPRASFQRIAEVNSFTMCTIAVLGHSLKMD